MIQISLLLFQSDKQHIQLFPSQQYNFVTDSLSEMQLHYKIISASSEDPASPVTNLILGNGIWQSSRFCQYPQQITIQFYQPVTVSSIHIASHNVKIASKVNVLFCLENNSKNNKFQKFGYFQYSDNLQTKLKMREMKRLQQININCTHMRLILWKNHQNQQNFFNQISLSHLSIYGTPFISPITTLPPVLANKSTFTIPISEYIDNKLQLLEQFKQQFSKNDDFQNAKKVKEIVKVIKNYGEKLKNLDLGKKNAISMEEYDKAKGIKQQMEDIKTDIEYLSANFYDPTKKTINPVLKDTKLKLRIDQMLASQNNSGLHQSRLSTKLKKVQKQILKQQKQIQSNQQQQQQPISQQQQQQQKQAQSRVSYDNRIIPAILRKNKKDNNPHPIGENNAEYEDNEFLEKSNAKDKEEEAVLEDMTPSAEVNAAVLMEFYEKDVVKKLHSKNWGFKFEALGVILQDTKKYLGSASELEKNRVKAVLFTFNRVVKQGNFQLNNINLDLLLQLVSTKKPIQKAAQTQLYPQLQKCLNQLFLKLPQSQKIKQKSQQIITKMLSSELYGTHTVYSIITKSYFNQGLTHNVKIKKSKLNVIDQMLNQFGIGSKNGLPLNSVEFMCKVAQDTNDQIRKQATAILKTMKSKGAGNKVVEVVRSKQSLKGSIVKQLQA